MKPGILPPPPKNRIGRKEFGIANKTGGKGGTGNNEPTGEGGKSARSGQLLPCWDGLTGEQIPNRASYQNKLAVRLRKCSVGKFGFKKNSESQKY